MPCFPDHCRCILVTIWWGHAVLCCVWWCMEAQMSGAGGYSQGGEDMCWQWLGKSFLCKWSVLLQIPMCLFTCWPWTVQRFYKEFVTWKSRCPMGTSTSMWRHIGLSLWASLRFLWMLQGAWSIYMVWEWPKAIDSASHASLSDWDGPFLSAYPILAADNSHADTPLKVNKTQNLSLALTEPPSSSVYYSIVLSKPTDTPASAT